MKSQQQVLQQILTNSIKKLRVKLNGQRLLSFEDKLQKLPKKIKQLDATPYIFIFKMLGQYKDSVDFTLHQYKRLIEQKFISPNHPEVQSSLSEIMLNNLTQQQFMITQLLMSITEPNLKYLYILFNVHTTIPLPENVLINFRATGVNWLNRTFHFSKGRQFPEYIEMISNKVFGENCSTLQFPTIQETNQQLKDYISKILNGMTFKVAESFQKSNAISGKFGFCFMCLQPAQYYCKDTKIPVCGSICKKQHLKEITNNHYLSQQYPQSFKEQIEQLLMANIQNKNSIALSVDYLCMIYMFSDYKPKNRFPHRALIQSALIQQRIWLLEASYHWKKGQSFEHIFAYGLKNPRQYIRSVSQKYINYIALTNPQIFFDIYWNYDINGPYRLIPIILTSLQKADLKNPDKISNFSYKSYAFAVELIQLVFNSTQKHKQIKNSQQKQKIQNQNKQKQNLKDEQNMIKLFNEDAKTFYQWYKDKYSQQSNIQQSISKFIVRNQVLLHKDGICDIIAKDQQFCKVFLKYIVQYLQYASVDQVIRQIFYYVNVNISQRIYRLLELLFEVYNPPSLFPGFNAERLFQFVYYLLMLHTDLHNPNVTDKKPKFQDMLARVKTFDQELSNKKQPLLKQIYERIAEEPFSQQIKPVNSIYRTVKRDSLDIKNFNPKLIVYDNWQLIYQKLQQKVKIVMQSQIETLIGILFKACMNVIKKPSLCQQFFNLLISLQTKINKQETSLHLAQAVSNILQQQPNAVQSWKNIFTLSLSFPTILDIQKFSILSKNLSNNQLIAFIKQMIISFPLAHNSQMYIRFLHLNEDRFKIINDHFIKIFIMEQNLYVQLVVLESCNFLTTVYFEHLNIEPSGQYLQTSEQRNLIFEANQKLFIDTLFCITNQSSYSLDQSKWLMIYKKTFNFTNIQVKLALAMIYKKNIALCPFYEQYIINQTLMTNSACFIKQIQPSIIQKGFDKFQKHIKDMSSEIKQIFITSDNLILISKKFTCFVNINKLYKILREQIISKNQQSIKILHQIILNLIQIENQDQKVKIFLNNQDLSKLLIDILFLENAFKQNEQFKNLYIKFFQQIMVIQLQKYQKVQFENIQLEQLSNFSYFMLELLNYFQQSLKDIRFKQQLKNESKFKIIKEIINIFEKVKTQFQLFNRNKNLRLKLMKNLSLQKIPGFLQHQKKICLIIFLLSILNKDNHSISIEILIDIIKNLQQNFSESIIKKKRVHDNKSYDQLLKKQIQKQLITWRQIVLQIINEIFKSSIKINLNKLQNKSILKEILKLNQSGYLQWNRQNISFEQTQFNQKMIQFSSFLLFEQS